MERVALKNKIKQFIAAYRNQSADNGSERKIRHCVYERKSAKARRKYAALMPGLFKKLAVTSLFTAATVMPVQQTDTHASPNPLQLAEQMAMAEQSRQSKIDQMVDIRCKELQKEIIANVDSLQKTIIDAARTGRKNQVITKIFKEVYPKGGFNGSYNYCVAGAMYARLNSKDEVLKSLLPDPSKRAPQNAGHPNVSCPYMRNYFKNNFGANYADRWNKDFKKFITMLEPGDIITVSSSRNSSSGEHCLTCAGKVENGKIAVKSFNGEKNYEVPVSRIVGAVRMMQQYREVLAAKLQKEINVERFIELAGSRGEDLNFIDYAAGRLSGGKIPDLLQDLPAVDREFQNREKEAMTLQRENNQLKAGGSNENAAKTPRLSHDAATLLEIFKNAREKS